MAKIENFWVVTKPTKNSVLDDILFQSDIQKMERQFLGGLKSSEIIGIFTERQEAYMIAVDALNSSNGFEKSYFRPKTQGELLEGLKQGKFCEVVASHEETSTMFLNGWLKFEGRFNSIPSKNKGWVIFYPL